eukprot:tig00000767_g3953.t1
MPGRRRRPLPSQPLESGSAGPALSVIVPCLNEEKNIERTLREARSRAARRDGIEFIVVDGGSSDRTVAVARRCGAQVLTLPPGAPRGRGSQLNFGGSAARGSSVLFLHADTVLPPRWDEDVERALQERSVIVGAFELGIRDDETGSGPAPAPPKPSPLFSLGLRGVELAANLRSRLLRMPYGDQALFLRRSTFVEGGGFPKQPLMEDFELVRRLRRRGNVHIVPRKVETSARRWQKFGILGTTLRNQARLLSTNLQAQSPLSRVPPQLTVAGYLAGVPPETLARMYYSKPKSAPEAGPGGRQSPPPLLQKDPKPAAPGRGAEKAKSGR